MAGFSSADAGLACIERHAFCPVRLYRDRDTERDTRGLVCGMAGFSSADAGLACVEECYACTETTIEVQLVVCHALVQLVLALPALNCINDRGLVSGMTGFSSANVCVVV